MKEGFWKKVLVGVVASLITLSAASLASSIVQRVRPDEEEESTANTCTHTKIIEVSGVAPTCTESGLTDGIFCGVCHGVIKAQQVIDPLGHMPIDVPGHAATCKDTGLTDGKICGVCEEVLVAQKTIPLSTEHNYNNGVCVDCGGFDTSTMKEVKAEKGELVAGNWYRMYRGEGYDDYSSFTLSCELLNSYAEPNPEFYATKGDGYGGFFCHYGRSGGVRVAEMQVVETEEYIDVYLALGVYTSGSRTFEITEETTITSISGDVYRLELPGGDE